MVYALLLTAVVAYLLGNHNGAVSVSAWIAHDDVRSHGSGNAGLTNFLRSYGSKSAILVVLVDVVKTAAACLVGGALLRPYDCAMEGMMLGAVMVSLGHDFPALMGFKGGKGILCGATAVFLLDWRIGAVLAVVFFSSVAIIPLHFCWLSAVRGRLWHRFCSAVLGSALAGSRGRIYWRAGHLDAQK